MFPVIKEFLLPWGDVFILRTYGVSLFVATLTAFFIFLQLNKKKYKLNELQNHFLVIALIFFLASWLSYAYIGTAVKLVIANPPLGFHYPSGTFAVLVYLAIAWRSKYHELPALLDSLIFALLPGIIIVHLAAFFAGSGFGKFTTHALSVIYDSNPIGVPMRGAVHPVQIYTIINTLFISIIVILYKRFNNREGAVFVLFMALWFILSFVLEFFRGDIEKQYLGLSFNQICQVISLALIMPLILINYLRNGRLTLLNLKKPAAKKGQKAKKEKSIPFSLRRLALLRVSDLDELISRIKYIILIFLAILLIPSPGQYWSNYKIIEEQDFIVEKDTDVVFINIPAMKLSYKGKEYLISPGKPSLQTPVGMGKISVKRKDIRFVYTIGWRKGEQIKYGHTLDGSIFKIPYEKMRGLGIKIKDYSDYVIHSTTEDWNIGKAKSSGCIRMRIPDMLQLYSEVKKNTPVVIDYILSELDGNTLVLYQDCYNLKSCFVDGEKVDFFRYTYNMVYRKTKREISPQKFYAILENADYKGNRIIVPLRELLMQ